MMTAWMTRTTRMTKMWRRDASFSFWRAAVGQLFPKPKVALARYFSRLPSFSPSRWAPPSASACFSYVSTLSKKKTLNKNFRTCELKGTQKRNEKMAAI